jgi:hypothetical protein
MNNLQSVLDTGDIIMFTQKGPVLCLVECVLSSEYNHVGLIVKNPGKCIVTKNVLPDGLYVLESRTKDVDVADGQEKLGVQLRHLDTVLEACDKGTVFVRHVDCVRDNDFRTKFETAYSEVYNKPYDLNLFDWVCGRLNITYTFKKEDEFRKTNEFWCSAMASYVLCKVGVIQDNLNWSIVAPKDFGADESTHLRFKCYVTGDMALY